MAKRSGKVQSETLAVQTSNSAELDSGKKSLPRREKHSRGDLYNQYYDAYMKQFMSNNKDAKQMD